MKREILFDLSNFENGATLVNSILSQKYRVIVSGGGIRGGKTYNNIGGLVLLHKKYPKSRSVIIRDSLETLKRNTLPSCQKAIPSNFIKSFNGQDYVWTFTNGSQMFFMSENYDNDKELDRFNGLEINFALLEQMEELQQATFEKTLERIGSYVIPNGLEQPKPMLLGTVNPTNTWVKPKIYDAWESNSLPEKWLYVPALLIGNPHIPQAYKESLLELKRVNPAKYKKFVDGSWDVEDKSGQEFYYNFDLQRHTGNVEGRYDADIPIHITFDFNYLPYMTCLVYQVQGNEILQIAEICLPPPGNTARNTVKAFLAEFEHHKSTINVYGDYSAKSNTNNDEKIFDIIFSELKSSNLTVIDHVKPNPSVASRGEFINEVFFTENTSYNFTVDEKCQKTISDFISVKKAADGSKLKQVVRDGKTGASYQKHGHCSDAFDYLVCELLKVELQNYKKKAKRETVVVPRQTNTRSF